MKSNVLDLSEVAKTEGDKRVFVDGVGTLRRDVRSWGTILKLNLVRVQSRYFKTEVNGETMFVSLTAIRYCPKADGVKIKARYFVEENGRKKMRRITLPANSFASGELPAFVEKGIQLVMPQAFAATQ